MKRHQVWLIVTLVLILGTGVLSGPLVGGVDLTPDPAEPQFGDGTVEVTSIELPENATLLTPRFGAGKATVRVPPARLQLTNVSGSPRLMYIIEIQGLTYTRSTATTVTAENEGTFDLTIEDGQLTADQISNSRYRGELTVEMWSNGCSRQLAQQNISVEVKDG
jgi:hypothetical protein